MSCSTGDIFQRDFYTITLHELFLFFTNISIFRDGDITIKSDTPDCVADFLVRNSQIHYKFCPEALGRKGSEANLS